MKKIWAILILIAAVFITYAPALRNGFVWDDTALVLRDPLIRSWRLIPEGFNHFLFVDATASDFYRPAQRLTYTLDYAVFAFRPAGYHFFSIFWHGIAAIALFLFAEELLLALKLESRKSRWFALIAAFIWAIHPVHSAAVAYVSGRADPLAAAFGFLGLFFLLRAAAAIGARQLILLIGGTLLLLCSALSRESGLVFPVVGIAFFALRKNWSLTWKSLAATAFVCAIYFSLRAGAEHDPAPRLTPPPPPLVRPIIAARAIAEYAGLVVFPLNLHMDRDVETQPTGFNEPSLARAAWRELQTLLGVILIAAVLHWMIRAAKRNPTVFYCLVCGLITYLPISGLAAWNATVAEHWIYVPSAFLFLALTVQLSTLMADRWKSGLGIYVGILVALWILFLAGRSFVRTFDWKDPRTFFARTIAAGGDSARMLINLAGVEITEEKLPEAAAHLHLALQKKPDQPLAILNLAAVALKQHDYKQARELLNRAIEMPVVAAQANQLLVVLEHFENNKADVMRMRLASRTGAPNWSVEKRYITLLNETSGPEAAIKELQLCLQRQWYRADSWKLLSDLEKKAGNTSQAAEALAQAQDYDVHLGEHPPD